MEITWKVWKCPRNSNNTKHYTKIEDVIESVANGEGDGISANICLENLEVFYPSAVIVKAERILETDMNYFLYYTQMDTTKEDVKDWWFAYIHIYKSDTPLIVGNEKLEVVMKDVKRIMEHAELSMFEFGEVNTD